MKNKIYQIFMGGFCKDLKDLITKLDYVKWMGFNSILLSPIFEANSYHKYDTINYYKIDPQFGTLDDFKSLVNKCEELNLNIFLDFVCCHTSTQHQWFKDAREGKNDYYTFSEHLPSKEFWYPTPMNENSWCQEGLYGRWYLSCWNNNMACLNLHSTELRKEIEDILKYWLSFSNKINLRLDAILYSDLIYGKATDICKWIHDYAKSINPNCKLIGEIWDNNHVVEDFASVLGSCFSFDDAGLIKHCAWSGDKYNQIGKSNLTGFISNHDMSRLYNSLGGNLSKIKKSFDILVNETNFESIVVYYGDEIGMQGDVYNNGTNHEEVRKPLDWEEVKKQMKDKNSLLNYVRNLMLNN